MTKQFCTDSRYNYEACPEDFGLSTGDLCGWVTSSLRDSNAPLVAVTRLSPREAENIMQTLNEARYDLWQGKYDKGTERYSFSLRKTTWPAHKHPFFSDCNHVLTINRAA